MDGHEYRHESERDRKWEEDVLYFAEKFLTRHPLAADDNFYCDPQLRAKFIADTFVLFYPTLEDYKNGIDSVLEYVPAQ